MKKKYLKGNRDCTVCGTGVKGRFCDYHLEESLRKIGELFKEPTPTSPCKCLCWDCPHAWNSDHACPFPTEEPNERYSENELNKALLENEVTEKPMDWEKVFKKGDDIRELILAEYKQKLKKRIRGNHKPTKPECNCDCNGPFCNTLVHPCKKPTKHTSQRDWMYWEFKKEVLDEVEAVIREEGI